MDIQLKGNMDGVETAQEIRTRLGVPVVYLTAYASEKTVERAKISNPYGYIIKPFTEIELRTNLEIALHKHEMEKSLQESEERFRKIFEESPLGIAFTDMNLRFIRVNAALCRMLGYTREQFKHLTFSKITHPMHHEGDGDALEKLVSGEIESHRAEKLFLKRNLGFLWANVTISLTRDENGSPLNYIATVEDINERKQYERERDAIVTLAGALRSAENQKEMLPIILEQATTLLQADRAALAMLDMDSGDLVFEAGCGIASSITGKRLPPGSGVSWQIMETGQPYMSNKAQSDPDAVWFIEPAPHASAAVPLVSGDKPIGVFWIGQNAPLAEGDVRILTVIGEIAANAIQRSTLHEKVRHQLEHMQALRTIDRAITSDLELPATLDIIVNQIISQLNVDAADVLILDPSTQTLEYEAGLGFRSDVLVHSKVKVGEDIAGRCIARRRIMHVTNFVNEPGSKRSRQLADEGFAEYYCAPLISKDKVKGVLELYRCNPCKADREWMDYLDALATQLTIAIDDAQNTIALQRSNLEMKIAYDDTIEGWARAMELRDVETVGHSQRVTDLSIILAVEMGIRGDDLVHIRRGALLHDIGKMGIPDKILFKPGPLTEEEWQVMHRHPKYGYEMLNPIEFLRPSLDIILYHHEKWDSTGYPRGLSCKEIPLAARLFAIIDVWDALLSKRPYRKAWSEKKVYAHIQEQSGKHFDPLVVEAFLHTLTKVEISRNT